jgi:hypothetical protein
MSRSPTLAARMTQTVRLVVTVKAYPTASVKYGETVCDAGIRTDTERPEWVRLYPVEFRDLPFDQQFKKWSEIELTVRPSSDSRPESRRPDTSTIRVVRQLDTRNGWAQRRPLVEPLIVESMSATRQRLQARHTLDDTKLNIPTGKPAPEWSRRRLVVSTRTRSPSSQSAGDSRR